MEDNWKKWKVGDTVTTDWLPRLDGAHIEILVLPDPGNRNHFEGKFLTSYSSIAVGSISTFTNPERFWLADPFIEFFEVLDQLEDGEKEI